MKLTEDQIASINGKCPNHWQRNEQGIFTQPNGIPVDIKGRVIYQRVHTGGVEGGSCWDESDPRPYTVDEADYPFTVLDMVLEELVPNLSYSKFKEIQKLIHTNDETEYEYYGNCTEYEVRYIILQELIELLNK